MTMRNKLYDNRGKLITGSFRFALALLAVTFLNSATASDDSGSFGALEMKGGGPKLVGVDANVSSIMDKIVDDAPVNDESAGASSDRPLSPGDPAPLTFNSENYVHTLELGLHRGSAVYVGNGMFLSAGHLFSNNASRITKIDGKQYGGKVARVKGADLSWFQLTKIPEMPAVHAVARDLREGERLTCYGKMSGKLDGVVKYDLEFSDGSVWLSTPGAGIVPGDSGGGAFDKGGNLVAILIADANDSDHVFVMPLNRAGKQIPTNPNLTSITVQHPIPNIKYLLFSAAWCGPCRIVKQTILPKLIEKGYTEDAGNLHIVDIDKEHDLAVEYDIMSIPTWVVLKDDKEIARIQGGTIENLLRKAGGL